MSVEIMSATRAVVNEQRQIRMPPGCRSIPFVKGWPLRMAIGFSLLVLAPVFAGLIFGVRHIEIVVLIFSLAWLPAVFLTDKYVHKYPQRYFTYLIASHLKAAILMAFFIWIMCRFAGPLAAPHDVLWTAFVLFVFVDALVSLLRRRDISDEGNSAAASPPPVKDTTANRPVPSDAANACLASIDTQAIIAQIRSHLDRPLAEFIEKNLPDQKGSASQILLLDDMPGTDDQGEFTPVSLLVGRTRINDVRRLNQYLHFCTQRIAMGGFLVVRYMPLENVVQSLKRRYTGIRYWSAFILHFIWYRAIPKIPLLDRLYFSPKLSRVDRLYLSVTKRRNRALSKAEVWGRLAYYGLEVTAESEGSAERYLMARRVAMPVKNKTTSYYPVVGLEKVGLDGKIMRLHKIRTMYPFSEFLQKRIFEDHGLASTGKFANDFRLTDYGKFIRKYWLDELPQLFDWLRGDIKLVGMRATSRHFLGLYPKELYDLYIQVKPGLIPPIFGESTSSFDQIVAVEMTYLKSYFEKPFRTDLRYLIQTFTDIVFRGVRSK